MRPPPQGASMEKLERPHNVGTASVSALPGRVARDTELMALVAGAGDRAAFEELARHYAPRLVAWLVHRGEAGATAEDIVQEVLIAVWRKASLFDPGKASFSAWLHRITRNRWIDHRRRHGHVLPTDPELMAVLADEEVDGAEKAVVQAEAVVALREAMALLSPEHKQTLFLAFFEGLSHSEIAARTGAPLGTVKSRIRIPLKTLRAKLKEHQGVGQ